MKKTLLQAPSKLISFYYRSLYAILLCLGISSAAYSQAGTLQSNYLYSESVNPANYVDITGGTVISGAGFANDVAHTTVTLPFSTFVYNNTAVTQITICQNGFITMGNAGPATNAYLPLSDNTSYPGVISAYGIDIRSVAATFGTSEIRRETLGTAPNQIFVVQYKNVRRNGDTTSGLMNMQIRLNEADNSIDVIYKENFNSAIAGPLTGEVGLRGATNTDFYNRTKTPGTITAGSFVVGQIYKITAVGNTDFTLIGAAGNFSGAYFTATGIGSGTGTAICNFWPGADGTTSGAAGATLNTQGVLPVLSPGAFIPGQQYQIVTVGGTPNFTAIGASSNTVGVNFVATGAGSGSGTATLTSQLVSAASLVTGKTYQIVSVGTTSFTAIGSTANTAGTNFLATGAGSGTGLASLLTAAQGYLAGTKLTWTPCFKPTNITAALQSGDITKVDINWTAPIYVATGGSYDYEVRTSGAAGSGSTGLFASGNQTANSVTVSGLAPGTQYFIYVKRNCVSSWASASPTAGSFVIGQKYQIATVGTTSFTALGAASNTVGVSFTSTGVGSGTGTATLTVTPTCSVATIPYTQNFESVTAPAIPTCNSVINSNGTYPNVTVDNTSVAFYGFNNKNFITTNAGANNEWFFTQAINFSAPGSYRLSYKYGGTRQSTFLEQKMKVYYGAANSAAGMTILLADHTSIKDSPLTNVVNFTVTTAGTYYIGFNCIAAASQGALQLDDINIIASTCLRPTALTSGQVTSTAAIISWGTTASATSGYEYYYTPATGATFTAGTFVIGQTYEILTIGGTSFNSFGASANTVGVVFTATAGAQTGTGTAKLITAPTSTVLPSGNVAGGTIIANLNSLTPATNYNFWVRSNCGGGDIGEWSAGGAFTTPAIVTYCLPSGNTFLQDNNGITNVTMGSINNTTGIEVNNYGDYSTQVTNVAQGATLPISITYKTGFTYDTTIWVDWNNNGLFTDAGELVYTGVSAGSNPATLIANITIPAVLGPRRIRIGGIDYGPTNGTPIDDNPFDNSCRVGRYQAFEDYTLYVIVPPPALTLSASTAILCEGATSPTITASVVGGTGLYQVYNWSPSAGVGGSLGAGYTFTPTATTTYILTATQTSGNFSSTTASYTVTVNPLPTIIDVTPATATTCESGGTAQLLTATGGIVSGVEVFNEDFNGATNSFTTVNNSTGTNPSASDWTLTNLTNTTSAVIRSNDSTQFYLSDSDQQGSGGITNTELISPVFSLAGFADAALSFWHYYRDLGGRAEVQISTDGGTIYTVLPGCNFDSNQGTSTNFKNVIVNLTGYVGQTNLRLKFKYINAPWAWWWAVDNIKVSGGATTSVSWSPSGVGSGLYTDSGATTVYSGTPALTVYAKPTVNTVYTASATSSVGSCTRYSNTATITVTPLKGGTASSDQSICGGMPADLNLVGSSGSIQWQVSSNNILFADISGATTTTLSSTQMGVLTGTRYYRASLTNGTCNTTSNVVTINLAKVIWNAGAWSNGTGPDSTMGAEFQSDFTSSVNAGPTGNISACNITITGGNILIDKGTMTVQGAVNVVGGTLTFDDQNYDVSLYQPNAATNLPGAYNGGNTGNITFTRNSAPMYKFDYTYWSTPVNPQTLINAFPYSPSNWLLQYNSGWQSLPSSTTMEVARGYSIRAPVYFPVFPSGPNNQTVPFYGVPNNGTITIPVVGGAGQFNLLGNPYPSSVSVTDFIAANANISGTLYFWTHNTAISANGQYQLTADYASHNGVGGVAATNSGSANNNFAPTGYIASGQGFFVKGLTTTPATFNNSMRRAGNNYDFFKSADELEKHRYWLNITNEQGAFKQALIGYVETATMGMDRLFDGDLIESGNVIVIYTKIDGNKLSIEGRSLPFDTADTIPLCYKSTIASTYSISMPNYDGLFTSQHVYLEDKVLQVIHDLRDSPYTFTTEIGTFENRFVLRYTTEALGTNQPVFNENSVVIYKNNQGLFINTGNEIMKSVTIYDIRGRQLTTQRQVQSTTTVFTNLPTTQQVLLVKIEGESGGTVTKKIVF